jgi:hypothetical protein
MGCGSSSAAQAGIAENTADDALGSTRDLRYNMVKSVRAVLGDTYEVHEKGWLVSWLPSLPEEPGQQLTYNFVAELGQAAMGCTVRKVVKKSTGDAFACKTFNIASVKGSKEQARLRAMLKKEIDLIRFVFTFGSISEPAAIDSQLMISTPLRSLDHPSIVRACEVFEDQVPARGTCKGSLVCQHSPSDL